MNLDERAELAFEHHIDNYGIDWGSNCELFTAGYRAATQSLYVEVDLKYVLAAWITGSCRWPVDAGLVVHG